MDSPDTVPGGHAKHVMTVPVGEQVPLPIQATSLDAAASAVDTCSAAVGITMPARAPSAAAWVIVTLAASERPTDTMP
jgi:hypothetical protein